MYEFLGIEPFQELANIALAKLLSFFRQICRHPPVFFLEIFKVNIFILNFKTKVFRVYLKGW